MQYHKLVRVRLFGAALFCFGASLSSASAQTTNSAGTVRYWMPKTILSVQATVKLRDCAAFKADIDILISARAEADRNAAYVFDPANLPSWRQSRDFSISMNANGTLAGFNSASEDKTGTIIGNILKTVLAVATIVGDRGTIDMTAVKATGPCTAGTSRAVARAELLRAQAAKLLDSVTAPGADAEKLTGAAGKLTAEAAAIESGVLTITLKQDIDPGDFKPSATGDQVVPISLTWPKTAFASWFVDGTSDRHVVGGIPAPLSKIGIHANFRPIVPGTINAKACKRSVAVPQPAMVLFEAGPTDEPMKPALTAPVQQYGGVGLLCLDAPLFASRTVNATFDSFGVLTKLDWKSNARGEAASAAAADLAGQLGAFATAQAALTPEATANAKKEADLAEQQVRLIKAQRCLAALQTGGSCE